MCEVQCLKIFKMKENRSTSTSFIQSHSIPSLFYLLIWQQPMLAVTTYQGPILLNIQDHNSGPYFDAVNLTGTLQEKFLMPIIDQQDRISFIHSYQPVKYTSDITKQTFLTFAAKDFIPFDSKGTLIDRIHICWCSFRLPYNSIQILPPS